MGRQTSVGWVKLAIFEQSVKITRHMALTAAALLQTSH